MKTVLRRIALRLGYQIQKVDPGKLLFDPSRGQIADMTFEGERVSWFVENPSDHIQSRHLAGEFFEGEELNLIRTHYDKSGLFVDIGANVGNHSIFVSKMVGGAGVIAFEPGLKQHALFSVNIALNQAQDHIRLHRCGLSDTVGVLTITHGGSVNLGRARVAEDFTGEVIQLNVGDAILGEKKISFIKIDVEGHELQVLRGLDETIRKNRPKIFVEVEAENEQAFRGMMSALKYRTLEQIDYGSHRNVLAGPN